MRIWLKYYLNKCLPQYKQKCSKNGTNVVSKSNGLWAQVFFLVKVTNDSNIWTNDVQYSRIQRGREIDRCSPDWLGKTERNVAKNLYTKVDTSSILRHRWSPGQDGGQQVLGKRTRNYAFLKKLFGACEAGGQNSEKGA